MRFISIILIVISGLILPADDIEDGNMKNEETYDRVCVVEEAMVYKDSICQKIAGVEKRWTFAKYLMSSDYNTEMIRLESGEEYWVSMDEWYIVYEVSPTEGETTDLIVAYKKYPEKGIQVVRTLERGELVGGTYGEALLGTIPVKTESGESGFVYYEDLIAVGDERFEIKPE